MKRGAALLALAFTGAAAQDGGSALAGLDRAGRAIAAAGCARPVEDKTSTVAGGEQMRALDCGAFRIASVVTPQGERPMALVVLADGPALPAGLSIGMDAGPLRTRFGAPAHEGANSLSYRLDPSRPGGDSITFELDAGRLRAVSFNWRVD